MKNKLPIEFKKKWVKALRSGRYKQSTGMLYRAGGYCCLGVACVIAREPKDQWRENQFIMDDGWEDGFKFKKIPDAIKGDNDNNQIVGELSTLNDDEVPFEVIAGVINEYL